MKKIEHKDIQTIDEYKAYKKQKAKEWYEKNKEKKQEYSRNYYYKTKNQQLEEAN